MPHVIQMESMNVGERKMDLKDYEDGFNEQEKKYPGFNAKIKKFAKFSKIGTKLNTLREEAGYSTKQMAKKLVVSKRKLKKLENNAEDMPIGLMEKYLSILGYDYKIDFFKRDEE